MKLTTHAIVKPELKALIIPLQDYWSHIDPIELSRVCLSPAHNHQSEGVSFAQQTAPWWHKYQKELTDFLLILGSYIC
ncbi:hypothetical protein CEDIAZO_02857 [Celerinatantimonas diazotrophica]|nr:hypothetical protein CEDIAZO_02857 [Celerinatantimonas diazotrophica]